MNSYYGYDWLTADQKACYDVMALVVHGEHHMNKVVSHGRGIKTSEWSGKLSTFDFDLLTRLVVLAHDACVRVEIASSGPGRVGIVLHKRHSRDGSVFDRHPTIEDATAAVRASVPKGVHP